MDNTSKMCHSSRVLRIAALAAVAWTSGCHAIRRDRGGSGTSFHGIHAESSSSGATVGKDLHSVPAGTTVPPTGLGVDLIRFDRSDPATRSLPTIAR
jgi:hypothetical protein